MPANFCMISRPVFSLIHVFQGTILKTVFKNDRKWNILNLGSLEHGRPQSVSNQPQPSTSLSTPFSALVPRGASRGLSLFHLISVIYVGDSFSECPAPTPEHTEHVPKGDAFVSAGFRAPKARQGKKCAFLKMLRYRTD